LHLEGQSYYTTSKRTRKLAINWSGLMNQTLKTARYPSHLLLASLWSENNRVMKLRPGLLVVSLNSRSLRFS